MQHKLCCKSIPSQIQSGSQRYSRYEIIISDLEFTDSMDSIVDQSKITFLQNLKLINNDLELVS